MSQNGKGPRLYRRSRSDGRDDVWVVRDGSKFVSTGVAAAPGKHAPPEAAQEFLKDYLAAKFDPNRKLRDIDRIPITDVLRIYLVDRIKDYDEETQEHLIRRLEASILRLDKYFGKYKLGQITTDLTNGYTASRIGARAKRKGGRPGGKGGSRRDLENLRSAIGHHAKQNLHHGIVHIDLPEKGGPRERWLTRSEAAHLIWKCWRYREEQTIHRGENKGVKIKTGKYTLRHVAKFILIGLYTGTRAASIASASIHKAPGKAYVDLDEGLYYRKRIGHKETNKRQPTMPIPDRLLAHMRRWVDKGIVASHFVEWHGRPVMSVKTGMASAVELAELDLTEGNVTPHTLRHTAATWLMQQGVELWQAAGYLGMSEKTLIDNYGHHHPDYMRDAAAMITQKRKITRSRLGRRIA
jgi:integrase